jgi:hypothetical protein
MATINQCLQTFARCINSPPPIGAATAGPTWTVVYSNQAKPVDIGEAATNAAFAKTMVFKRDCTDCDAEHATVFYKRITPIGSISTYNLMKNLWASSGNQLNKDFKLYSTYADLLVDKNAWQFCNYDDTGNAIGGFRDCGKTSGVGFQWNSEKPGWPQKNSRHVTYSVLDAPSSGTSGYAIEGQMFGGMIDGHKEWSLIMILLALAIALWIIVKKM